MNPTRRIYVLDGHVKECKCCKMEMDLSNISSEVHIQECALLSGYTTFQLGGSCPVLLDCPTADALVDAVRVLQRGSHPFVVIGQGSNLLVSDQGMEEIVVRYCAEQPPKLSFDGKHLRVAAHILLDDLVAEVVKNGWGDLAFCSGIPGTLGGAISGNAGAFGRQIGDVVESVRLLNPAGEVREVFRDELGFSYRQCAIRKRKEIILDATLSLSGRSQHELQEEREEILRLRKEKHPDWRMQPCAGSVFKNIKPTSNAGRRQAAGWFLEQVGGKEFTVGCARIFEKHANIIIAEPGATAEDVHRLMEKMICAVQDRFGIILEPEIQQIGLL